MQTLDLNRARSGLLRVLREMILGLAIGVVVLGFGTWLAGDFKTLRLWLFAGFGVFLLIAGVVILTRFINAILGPR